MKPFRVWFRLATPVALNHPWLHLDGILEHLWRLQQMGRDYYYQPSKVVVPFEESKLLATWRGVPRASVSFFRPEGKLGALRYYKRFHEQGFPGRRKVSQGSGHFRTWMLRWVYVPAEYCEFWGYGDIERIADLLQDLTHLGNDTRVGWGRIASWGIEAVPPWEDRSLFWEGRATRPIPKKFLRDASDVVPLAWRSPYWARESIDLCATPGAEIWFWDNDQRELVIERGGVL